MEKQIDIHLITGAIISLGKWQEDSYERITKMIKKKGIIKLTSEQGGKMTVNSKHIVYIHESEVKDPK